MMITEEEFLNKVSELMDKTKEDALESAKKLYHSGAINKNNPDYQDDNYVLPKLFLVAYSTRLKSQWSPFTMQNKWKREIKNMEYFI